MQHTQSGHLGLGNKVELGLCNGHQRALGTHDKARHVEAHPAHELVQVVAGHTPLYLRVASYDLVAVSLSYTEQTAIYVSLQSLSAHPGLKLSAIQPPEPRGCTVGQHHIEFAHVVHGLAPHYRVRSAGVVAKRAAHISAVRRGRVRREQQTTVTQLVVEHIQYNSGLRANPALLLVDLDDVVHVLGEVHDYGMSDGLTAEAGAASPWQDGHAIFVGRLDDCDNVLRRAWNDYANRLDLVDACVRGIQDAAHLVEPYFTRYQLVQVLDHFAGIGFSDIGCHSFHLTC